MIRREIKRFELVTNGERYECTIPFSVKSVLTSAGAELDCIGDAVKFESVIHVDDVALAMKNFYLRIKGLSMPAKVYIGDKLVLEADGVTPFYNIDASGIMSHGDNVLSIKFSSSDGDILYAGISHAVEILRFSCAIIDRVSLLQNHTGKDVELGIKLDLIGDSASVRAIATLVSSTGQIYYGGLTKGEGTITVKDPLFWWPKGQGVQNLYRLTVNLYGDSDVEDTAEIRLGLRTCCAGNMGKIIVNGINVLPMGAVYIPEGDPDTTSADRRTEAYVTSASMANYNCLVIPYDAPTPSEKFYELCDIHGIMVIEEHTSLDSAVIESLRHRSNHPSLCLIDLIGEGDHSYELEKLNEQIPGMAVELISAQPEYIGLPALPSMKTICGVIPESERNLFSHSIEAIAEDGAIRDMLMSVADRYPYPSNLSGFAYASALAAAHQVGEMVKDARLYPDQFWRAVFYRLSDPEMAISASAIDSRARWKPLQYYASRYFAPITVYADFKEGIVGFSVSNQRKIDCIGTLEYRIADASNYTIYKESVPCEIEAMSSVKLHSASIGSYIAGHEREYYLEYYIKEASSTLSKKTLLFVPEKHFIFKKPKIKTVISGQDRRFGITVSSDAFVKDMEISFDGVDAVFDDNYFDLTSEAPVKINFTVTGGMETAYHLKDVLEMKSVFDLNK